MNDDELSKKIKELKPWYQNVKFNEEIIAISSHSKLSGEFAWKYIKQLLPESLEGKRILDLGSNAGLFCIRCAQMEAEEVIGIERESKHLKQCTFLKEYFEVKNVKFMNVDLMKLHQAGVGRFDIVLAISVLYWVGREGYIAKGTHYNKKYRDKEFEFIKYISTITNEIIVRARGKQYNDSFYYSELFDSCEFDLIKLINEDHSPHEMMLFRRKNNG